MRHFGNRGREGGREAACRAPVATRQRTCISRGSSCLGLAADDVLKEVGHVCCCRCLPPGNGDTETVGGRVRPGLGTKGSWRKWGGCETSIGSRLASPTTATHARKGQGSEICLRAVFPTYLQPWKCGGGQASDPSRWDQEGNMQVLISLLDVACSPCVPGKPGIPPSAGCLTMPVLLSHGWAMLGRFRSPMYDKCVGPHGGVKSYCHGPEPSSARFA